MKFNRLEILEEAGRNHNKKRMVKVRCDCGKEFVVQYNNIQNGHTKSCGCYWRDTHILHNLTGSRIYHIWENMKRRCNSDKNYVERNIKVCERWQAFLNFYEDMKDGYTDDLSIDRINNNDGYYKENCRWADKITQMNNTRMTENAKGYTLCKKTGKYAAQFSYNKKHKFLGYYDTPEEASQVYRRAKEMCYAQ